MKKTFRVLIVDDFADASDMLRTAWESAGCEVVTARDGADGLIEIIRSIKTTAFDLMVVDVAMPYVDGVSLIKAIHCLEHSGVLQSIADILIYTGHEGLYEQMQDLKGNRITRNDCYLKDTDAVRLLDDVMVRIKAALA
jgi:CheY-like chemotaxis protein